MRMQEPFDKKLADHFRQALEGGESAYEPGAWERFEQLRKRPQQRRKRALWLSAAACLLVGIALAPGLLRVGPPAKVRLGTDRPTESAQRWPGGKALSESDPAIVRVRPGAAAGGARTSSGAFPQALSGRPGAEPAAVAPGTETRPVVDGFTANNHAGGPVVRAGKRSPAFSRRETPGPAREATAVAVPAFRPEGWKDLLPLASRRITPAAAAIAARPLPFPTAQNASLPAAAPDPGASAGTKRVKQFPEAGPFKWGLSLVPQYAYAPQSPAAMGLGGAFHTEFALTKRLGIGSGLLVARQSVRVPSPGSQPFAVGGGTRQLASTGVEVLTLDVPLNLVYAVRRQQSQSFYLSAGLSSLTHLSERYAYAYQTSRTEVRYVELVNGQVREVQQTVTTREVETDRAAGVGQFRFGRLLNVSVALERSLRNHLLLTVEPYFKYPLGMLTREHIRLGSGGVYLRIGWKPAKRQP